MKTITFYEVRGLNTAELDKADTNYMVIWDDDSDIFEIFNLRSNKSTFLDFSAELENLD